MNYENACSILKINSNHELSIDLVKKQYRFFALKYHPDKNGAEDAAKKFIDVKSAYEYLSNYLEYDNSENEYEDDDDYAFSEGDKNSYKNLLFSFLSNLVVPETGDSILKLILHRISNTCEEKAIEILEKLDKTIAIKIYEVIQRNGEIFHFSPDFYSRLEAIFKEKIKDDEYIILNPDINDLFENNLYKLTVDGSIYAVPLWHHELIYDNSGSDIYVRCKPSLPENISIDNKNKIIVCVKRKMVDIWQDGGLNIQLGTRSLWIDANKLKISKYQTYVLEKEGISKINTVNIYDVSKRTDIIVDIMIE